MTKITIVIFTIADDKTNGYLKIFFPLQDWEADWKCLKHSLTNEEKKCTTEFVFINDLISEGLFNNAEKNNIKRIIDDSSKNYIVFHRTEKFSDIFRKNCWTETAHHNNGWSFDYLCKISQSINNIAECEKIINEFVKKFLDPILEAKLIINKFLHIYLRENKNKKVKKSEAYSFVIGKINEKIPEFKSDSLPDEEKKKFAEFEKWKKENDNSFDYSDIESLNLFPSDNV